MRVVCARDRPTGRRAGAAYISVAGGRDNVFVATRLVSRCGGKRDPKQDIICTGRPSPCQQIQDLLPEVVPPMVGMRPVWLVDRIGALEQRRAALWVLLRTSEEVRIGGRRLDGPGALTLRRGDNPLVDTLVIAHPAKQSVTPRQRVAERHASLCLSTVSRVLSSPGCWEVHGSHRPGRSTYHPRL